MERDALLRSELSVTTCLRHCKRELSHNHSCTAETTSAQRKYCYGFHNIDEPLIEVENYVWKWKLCKWSYYDS